MGLQSESAPDSHDRILRQAYLLRHETGAPMRAVGWHGFECFGDDTLNLLIGDLAGSATRGSSSKPSNPNSLNRSRHFPTVAPVICSFRATSALFMPSPQLSTIRARMAIACADLGRRAIMLNFSRSASTISRGFLGRPVRIPQYEAKAVFIQRFYRSGH